MTVKGIFMKQSRKILAGILSLILCLAVLTSCSDQLNKAPSKVSSNHQTGDSVNVDEMYFDVEQSFQADDKRQGYINGVDVKADILGYDADYTYFNCYVTITWTYTVISDAAPTGEVETFGATIELDASGNGHYKYYLELDACRSVYDVKVAYQWHGTATKL